MKYYYFYYSFFAYHVICVDDAWEGEGLTGAGGDEGGGGGEGGGGDEWLKAPVNK